MLTPLRRLLLAGLMAAGLVLAGAAVQSAAACGATGCAPSPGPSAPTTSGHTITVRVTGSFVGSGSGGSGGSTTVSVPAPCFYTAGFNGAEYYEWVHSGKANHEDGGAGATPYVPVPGYESHKDDTTGHYYGGECDSDTFGDDLGSFFKFANAWFAQHGEVWVPAGQQPPLPPVPPKVLLLAAQKAMTLPKPTFDWNPKAQGEGASLVNLDTWFWLNQDLKSGSVTASAGDTSVTVTAARTSVTFSSPTAGAAQCDDGGTPYSPGASSSCVLNFQRATDAAGTPVTSRARWDLSWTANGAPQGALAPIYADQVDNVRVIEVQALSTSVR